MSEKKGKKRPLLPQIMCGLALSFMMLVFAPVEMVATNSTNFWFKISDFLPVFLLLAAAVFAAVEIVYLLLRRLPYAVWILMTALLFGVVLAMYVQGTYLCLGYETLTSGDPVWRDMLSGMLVNTAVWGAILLGSAVFGLMKPKLFLKAVPAACALIMVMQGAAMAVLLTRNNGNDDLNRVYCSTEDQLTFSQNGDVIVVLLDTLDTRLVDQAIEEEPEYAKVLDDFTYYRNTSSSTMLTDTSVTSLLTGEVCRNEEPFFVYCRRTMRGNTFFKAMKDAGMTVNCYGMPENIFGEEQLDVVDNLSVRDAGISSWTNFVKEMLCMTGYRYMPAVMQPFMLRDYLNNFAGMQQMNNGGQAAFIGNNTKFRDLMQGGEAEIDNNRRFFKFYKLWGAHKPTQIGRNMEDNDQATQYEEMLGCLKMTDMLFEKLRSKGVYDKATIIVLGDHGVNDDWRRGVCNPAMLVKYPGETGPMRISDAPAALLDMRATALYGAGLSYEGMGKPVHEWEGVTERERTLLQYVYDVPSSYKFYMNDMTEYIVPQDATDLDAYVPSGNVYKKPQ